jgi:myosin-5
MSRLEAAVAQRNLAREEAVMAGAQVKQLQEGRMAPPAAASGHLLASAATSSQEASSGMRRSYPGAASPGRENGAPAAQPVPAGRTFEGPGGEALSEMDRRQRELYAKQQQLLREQRTADQARLLAVLQGQLGFHQGRPVAAVLVFRCCLQWKAFQADRTSLFDDITRKVLGHQVELHQEDNAALAYWLSNSVTLLYLMQKHVKPVSGGGGGYARLRQSGQQARSLLGSAGKSLSNYFGGRPAAPGSPGDEASIHGGAAGGLRQVEAKYPALLFKQQLDAFMQRIFPRVRDNVKAQITPHMALCIHAPRASHGGRTSRRPTPAGPDGAPGSARGAAPGDASSLAPWSAILAAFDDLLATLRANFVPPFVVRKLLEQLFSIVNVQLFNQLLLRRECCSFSNGEYVKTGLSEVELWVVRAGREFVGEAWDQLAHIRQAVGFLVIHQKARKSLQEITQDLCPVLSVQQLYRISTMYWDDRYGTETVSHEVLARMKQLMVEGANASAPGGHSFLLDDDTATPFTQEEIAGSMDDAGLLGELPAALLPQELREAQSFNFLAKRLEVALGAAA